MRTTNKEIVITSTIVNNVRIVKEMLIVITEDKVNGSISVDVGLYSENNELEKIENYVIKGAYYDLLMSESPNFAPNKPLNEYREEDLWYIIDLISGAD